MTVPDPSSAASPLRLLFWESTTRCNLACRHCRRLDTQANSDDLTPGEFRDVMESAATLGRPIVVFSGGEPLLRNDWEPLAVHATRLGLPAAMATNGTLIDDPLADRIAAARFHRVSVSLDGADAVTHDAFRGVDGAFRAALDGIGRLRNRHVPLQINATVAAHNVHQLDALYALAQTLEAAALHLFLLVPVGCGAQIGPRLQLPPDQYEQVLLWICRRRQAAGPKPPQLKATCAPHYHRVATQQGLAPRGRGCLCGSSVVFVSHQGEVFPCGYLPVSCGSVRQQSLADIWRTSIVLAQVRDPQRLEGACGACNYKAVCGGCRARAYAAGGNYLVQEPSCILGNS